MSPSDLVNDLPRYADWAPTGFDPSGAFIHDERAEWRVLPVMRNRDSDVLTRSNFRVAVASLESIDPDCAGHEVHRFGHWANGWFEIILVDPDGPAAREAADIVSALDGYPVLDESDWSELEYEEAATAWGNMGTRERIEVCARYRVSIFAARRDEVPDCDSGEIVSYLAG